MRIAVNTRLLKSGKLDGIGWFSYETLKRIVTKHPEHQFYFIFDHKPSSEFLFSKNVYPVEILPPARHPILWYLFFEWSVPYILKKYKIDLFLSPDGWMPLHTSTPILNVIHDINFEHQKGNLKPSHQIYMAHYFPLFAQKATRIATVSEFSKQDIAETYHINPEKIDVVYDGAHEMYHPCTKEEIAQTQNKYTQGAPFFIFISTIIKRKNLTNILLAFDQFKQNDTQQTKLIVVGAKVWWKDELKEAYDNMQHQNDVIFIGRAEPNELALLLGSSIALVYPSFFEGFGMPILEAFYAETAVITSNTTSMPEVAGDAALLVDPYEKDEIANAMYQLANNANLREHLIELGKQQRKKFSWDITANKLWESLIHTYNHHE